MRQRLLILICGLALALIDAASAGPIFRLNGQPYAPQTRRVLGDGTSPGDVLYVDGHSVVLREAAKYDFETDKRSSALWLNDGTQRRLVAVRIQRDQNPVTALSEAEIAGLWGVQVDQWSDTIAAQLAKLDLRRSLVTFNCGIGSEEDVTLPPFSRSLSYVAVESYRSPLRVDLRALDGASGLLYLSIRLLDREELSLGWLQESQELRHLRTTAVKTDLPPAVRFPALHTLALRHCTQLTHLDFVRSMPALELLQLNRTAVANLAPIAELKQLRELDADGAPIAKLPAVHLPALQVARLLLTQVSDQDAAAFAKANPQAKLFRHWKEPLQAALPGVTKVRVRSGGTCHRQPAEEKVLVEIAKPAEIDGLVGLLNFDEARSGFHCMCCGDPSIEFYAGEKLLVTLGYHHGRSLRWSEWPGDALLTDTSAAALAQWMAQHGVPGPAAEYKESKRPAAKK